MTFLLPSRTGFIELKVAYLLLVLLSDCLASVQSWYFYYKYCTAILVALYLTIHHGIFWENELLPIILWSSLFILNTWQWNFYKFIISRRSHGQKCFWEGVPRSNHQANLCFFGGSEGNQLWWDCFWFWSCWWLFLVLCCNHVAFFGHY